LLEVKYEFDRLDPEHYRHAWHQRRLSGEPIDRSGVSGPSIPAGGSSIPKAKRPKPGAIGGPAAAGV